MVYDWVGSLDFLRGNLTVLLILATAVFILMIPDSRLALLGLAVQYFGLMLLYLDIMDARLALVKLLVGWFVCLILFITGQQVNWGRLPKYATSLAVTQHKQANAILIGEKRVPVTAVHGVLALVMLGIVWLLAQQNLPFLPALPEALAYVNLAVYGLVGFGLLGVLTASDEPLRAGMGVLMLLAGLELYYTGVAQDFSLAGMALLAALNLIVALVIAFLTQKRYTHTMVSPG